MAINLKAPELRELKPRIMVCGVGGAGGNAVNNMITSGLYGVDFIVANTDAQALTSSKAERIIQMGLQVTEGLGAGSQPEIGRAAAEEAIEEIRDHLVGAHMVFVTAGMGGGTGTGAAPVVARMARDMGILTVGVVTKPFQFEGQRRMKVADSGINELQKAVDTLIVIPNQNLFRVATERTTFADAFAMADQVLYSGVACITDLMVKEGLINLDFADVRAIMREMGKAMMGTGEASGDKRAIQAAEAAIANPLLDEVSMKGARGLLISITGGNDLTLYEVDEAASRIRQEVDEEANIILGATFDNCSKAWCGCPLSRQASTNPPKWPTRRWPRAVSPRRRSGCARRRRAAMPNKQRPHRSWRRPRRRPKSTRPPAPVYAASEPAQATHLNEVHIQPAPPRPHYEPAPAQRAQEYAPQSGPFIPPAAEQPVRAPRMPQIEDLPLPVQQQIRAQRGEAPAESPTETRRRTLLERLASFGMSRQDEAQHAPQVPALPAAPRLAQQPARPAPAPVHHEYARRPAAPAPAPAPAPRQVQLDPHGRATPVVRSSEDDHLEIPAFLRRQSS